ncbi:undecaprenyl-diphosphate phosphatase [bacterium]|nr:undecaprenyl-diphosphate phosphatase [bacterium]
MQILDFIILGIIQGLTEFLPVSSSGHLVLAQNILGMNPHGVTTEIVLHLATLISVLVVYGRDLLDLLRQGRWNYIGAMALATVVTAALALPFKDRIEAMVDGPQAVHYVGIFLLVTAGLLLLAEFVEKRLKAVPGPDPLETPGWGRALAGGIAQAVAVMPGISRSGSTISMMLLLGLDYGRAARFSFLLSVPAILGAVVLSLPDMAADTASGNVPFAGLLAGFIAAAVCGVLAIRFLLTLLRKRRLYYFSIYCAAVGIWALLAN